MSTTTGAYGTSQMPLAGAILCFTSVAPEQRTELSVIGAQMGAQVKLDLTSDVTHLIVGSTNSAKYRYVAKAREDVKVLLPEWIHALQKVWMEGDDVNVLELEQHWRLPTFYGLKICLTGFDNPEQRKYIQESVMSNGAEYHGDLTKAVTHLIAAKPSGSKYDHAVNWRIKIVTWEWLEQSLERRMALDEAYFHPTMAVEDRGIGAWDRRRDTSPMLGKRMRAAEQPKDILNPLRRKLRRSASTRLNGQTEALWAGITAGGLEKKADEENDWTEDDVGRTESLLEQEPPTIAAESRTELPPQRDPASRVRGPFSDDHDGIFGARVICIRGFDKNKTNILREHLDSNGAEVVCDAGDLDGFPADELGKGFLLVPHDIQLDRASLPEAAGNMTLVTNWWVERCLHGKRLVDPTDYVLCKPFDKLRISGFEGLTINSTGFAGIELLHVTKAIALFGATYDEILSAKISVLISHNRKPNAEKLKYATEKGIPVVHANWLWDCVKSGQVQPYIEYLLDNTRLESQNSRKTSDESSREMPTAPLTKAVGLRAQKHTKQPRPTFDAPQRSGALELSRSGHLTPSTTGSTSPPTTLNDHSKLEVQQDAQLTGVYDGGVESLPLQDVDPGVNSPRKSSINTAARQNMKSNLSRGISIDAVLEAAPALPPQSHVRQPSPNLRIPPETAPSAEVPVNEQIPPPPEKDYSDIMSKLLASRKTSVPVDKEEEKGRRRRRPLGRAQSTRSNTSTAADEAPSRQSSTAKVVEEEEMGDHDDDILQAFKPPEPSQQLGWDSPGAQRAREKMIRAIGGNVLSESTTIQETKVVRDAVSETALGMSRSTRKRKG